MNAQQKWAKEFTENSVAVNYGLTTEEAFLTGLRLGLNKAAEMIEHFENPKFSGVPVLIRAIGTAKVCDHGNAQTVCDQEPCKTRWA